MNRKRIFLTGMLCLLLTGCGTTEDKVEQPVLQEESIEESEAEEIIQEVISIQETENHTVEAVMEVVNTQVADTPTQPDKLLTKIEYQEQEVVLVPTQANLVGMHSGYLFVPIGEEVYRYEQEAVWQEDSKVGELLLETEEQVDNQTYHWKIYALADYPGHEKVLCARGDSSLVSSIYRYAPALATDQEIYEEALQQGFVIFHGIHMAKNLENWEAFLEAVAAGKPACIQIGRLYLESQNVADDLKEATKEDYDVFFMEELSYDGVGFTLAPVNWIDGRFVQCEIPGYNSHTVSFPYLMHYKNQARSTEFPYYSYERYVLTEGTETTWEDLEMDSLMGIYSMQYWEIATEYDMK